MSKGPKQYGRTALWIPAALHAEVRAIAGDRKLYAVAAEVVNLGLSAKKIFGDNVRPLDKQEATNA